MNFGTKMSLEAGKVRVICFELNLNKINLNKAISVKINFNETKRAKPFIKMLERSLGLLKLAFVHLIHLVSKDNHRHANAKYAKQSETDAVNFTHKNTLKGTKCL